MKNKKKKKHKIKLHPKAEALLKRIFSFGLQKRMIVVYLIGGLIPSILIQSYLVQGTEQLLLEQYEMAEEVQLNNTMGSLREVIAVMEDVSRRFYMDEQLEKIASRSYETMEQVVSDYTGYTTMTDCMTDYSDQIKQITIYMENETISENAYFRKITNSVRQKKWYQDAIDADGKTVWADYADRVGDEKSLSLIRLIRNKQREVVGTLVIQLKNECLENILEEMGKNSMLVLNDTTTLVVRYIEEKKSGEEGEKDPFVSERARLTYNVRYFLQQHGQECELEEFTYKDNVYLLSSKKQIIGSSNDEIQLVSIEEYDKIISKTTKQRRQGVMLIVVSVIITILMIWILSRNVTKRVNLFASEMEKAANGRFDLKESLGGSDEFEKLYVYLKQMIVDMQRLLTQVYREQMGKERLNSRQREVEFKMLSSQINPHFLYNTLETIRMKARLNGQTEIEELVKMLAKIMRRNIQVSNTEVTIQSEIKLLEYYLKIQQYRFGERVKYEIVSECDTKNHNILPLLIQPIVENAVVHGLESKEANGYVKIRITQEDELIKIYVSDNGIGIEPERLKELFRDMQDYEKMDRTHIGVSNVNQRIQLYYGKQYGLLIESNVGEGTTMIIRIPCKAAQEKTEKTEKTGMLEQTAKEQ